MTLEFDAHFGQALCDMLALELGLGCSFMGAGGRIVASSLRDRIGLSHAMAARIMDGELDDYEVDAAEAARSSVMREGVNMGIDFEGVRIICLAVAGPLQTVRPIARIVRFGVVSMLHARQGDAALRCAMEDAERLVESKTRDLRHFAELSADWFWTQDAELRFTEFSGHSTGKLRREKSDFFGKKRWEMPLQGVTPEQLAQHIATCERHEPFQNFEYEIPSAEGVPQYYAIRGLPIFDEQGVFVGYHGTGSNVTELRLAQKALEDRSRALQEANSEMEVRVAQRTAELSQQLALMKQLIEAIPGPVFYKDAQARFLGCNSAFEAFIGHPAADLIGKTPHDIFDPVRAAQHLEADLAVLNQPGAQVYEGQVYFANGALRDVLIHKASFQQSDGSVGGLVGLMLDITERKQMEATLRQAATVFANSAEGVVISTPDGAIVAVNRAFTEITGYAESEVIGRNPRLFQSGRHSPHFYRDLWASVTQHGRWQGEIWNRRKSGEVFPEWITITAVHDTQKRLTHYVAVFSDITQQKQTAEEIQLLAFTDPLTGLPNRRLLLDRLEHALMVSSRNHRYGALFFIDLDNFKGLNDTRGHYVGDLLLKQVAQRIAACVRECDTVARLGGDEFVVMLQNLSENTREATSQVEHVGQKILAALDKPYTLQDIPYHSTASLGVTLFGDQASTLEDLLKQADMAMYQAKASGRNALRFFDPAMQAAVAARVALESDLRQGLQAQQFALHYQPQVEHSGGVTGAEALLRWHHPRRGPVSPIEFIALAEETGLIVPLGLWVLETACQQVARWASQAGMAHLTVAVNVSAHQFRQPDFVAQVLGVLDRQAIDPTRLKLELTESLLLADVDEVISKMGQLKSRGVCFSLDDFGTGYSSLSYLKRLPLDQLKIDQSFVRDVLSDPNDAAIARTIVALAHSLGLGVIAEGVETEDQLLFLASHGCHAYQGYLFSRPVPLAEFEWFAAEHPCVRV